MRIRRHRRTSRQVKKQKKIIIISLVCFMFLMVGGYSAFQTNLNITAKGNIKEKSRIIQSWWMTSETDFHTSYYRENIISVTFLDTANVSSNAVDSWNVSEDKTHGGVMAWVVPNNEDNTKYDLYIGANNGVIANEDSKYLFYRFTGVKEINFGNNFDTSNVLKMLGMFTCCTSLETIDLSSFDTRNVTNMGALFSMWDSEDGKTLSSNLTSITFGSKWDTSNVTTFESMFFGLTKIKNLDVSFFSTQNAKSMYHMFLGCGSLIELNLCSWDTSNVTSMTEMFSGTSSIKNIFVGDGWTTTLAESYNGQSGKGTTGMFANSGVSSVTTGQCDNMSDQ